MISSIKSEYIIEDVEKSPYNYATPCKFYYHKLLNDFEKTIKSLQKTIKTKYNNILQYHNLLKIKKRNTITITHNFYLFQNFIELLSNSDWKL